MNPHHTNTDTVFVCLKKNESINYTGLKNAISFRPAGGRRAPNPSSSFDLFFLRDLEMFCCLSGLEERALQVCEAAVCQIALDRSAHWRCALSRGSGPKVEWRVHQLVEKDDAITRSHSTD